MVGNLFGTPKSSANISAVWLVAPATKQSGKGGTSDFTTEGNLTAPSQYDLIPKGAPSVRFLKAALFEFASEMT